jgi:hypothetical protein
VADRAFGRGESVREEGRSYHERQIINRHKRHGPGIHIGHESRRLQNRTVAKAVAFQPTGINRPLFAGIRGGSPRTTRATISVRTTPNAIIRFNSSGSAPQACIGAEYQSDDDDRGRCSIPKIHHTSHPRQNHPSTPFYLTRTPSARERNDDCRVESDDKDGRDRRAADQGARWYLITTAPGCSLMMTRSPSCCNSPPEISSGPDPVFRVRSVI